MFIVVTPLCIQRLASPMPFLYERFMCNALVYELYMFADSPLPPHSSTSWTEKSAMCAFVYVLLPLLLLCTIGIVISTGSRVYSLSVDCRAIIIVFLFMTDAAAANSYWLSNVYRFFTDDAVRARPSASSSSALCAVWLCCARVRERANTLAVVAGCMFLLWSTTSE